GRFAGSIVPDEPEANAPGHVQADAAERANRSEALFNAVKGNDKIAVVLLHISRFDRKPKRLRVLLPNNLSDLAFYFFMLASIAFLASSTVYSALATLPFGMFSSAFSKLS